MTFIALGLFLLLLGYLDPALRLAALPLGAFFTGYGVGGLLHRWGRHVLGYLAVFLGVVAAVFLIQLPGFTWGHKFHLAVVAFGFFLNAVRFFSRRLKRVLAPVSIAVTTWGLGSFLQLTHISWLYLPAWGVGAGAFIASSLGLLRGRVGRFFAKRTALFGVLGGLLAVLYYAASLAGATWVFYATAVGAVAALLLLGVDVKRPRVAHLYDDPDVVEAKRLERRFVETGDVSLLVTYVAFHMARGGVEEEKVLEAVRAAMAYRDLEPSPFAPPLVARLVERWNRHRRERHLRRVMAFLKRYL